MSEQEIFRKNIETLKCDGLIDIKLDLKTPVTAKKEEIFGEFNRLFSAIFSGLDDNPKISKYSDY